MLNNHSSIAEQRFAPKSILVTGGCGFIGSNFVNEVWSHWADAKIYNLDSLQVGNVDNVVEAVQKSSRYQFICGDYRKERLVGSVLRDNKIDTVIHFAATSSVDESYADPLDTYDNNVTGMLHFLRACSAAGSRLKRFVHISTDEVYGDSGLGPNEAPRKESDPLEPTNPYAATKAACEQLIHTYRHSHGLPALIVRMNNVYGPHQDDSKVVPRFIKLAMAGEAFTIAGNGSQLRNWLYVSDACDAIRRLTVAGKIGETYNIGTLDEHCILDFAKLIHRHLSELNVLPADDIKFVSIKDKPYNDHRYLIDSTKIKNAVGWMPAMPFEVGLRHTVRWYMENLTN